MSIPLKELIERHAGGVRGTVAGYIQMYYSGTISDVEVSL